LILLGAIGFCGLLAEGAVADWSAVYLDSSLTTSPALAAAGFAAFSLTMTIGRLVGDRLAQAWGPVVVTRRGGVLAGGGLGVALLLNHPAAAVVGFACVGAGLAAIVPVIFSSAGRLPSVAPGPAIAAVSVAGYTGFLVGPPLIGLTAEVIGLPLALGLVALLCGGIVALAPCVAPSVPTRVGASGLPAAP
ncbi:MAG: MFS transporter, partial [Chloroflexota bacterium]|nr:MFS transporter [Chloroflexota bacterium]